MEVNEAKERIRQLYLADAIPWICGYSGGKDSTVTLQLVWEVLEELAPEQRHKTVHVISTDTGVEQPLVAAWAEHSLKQMAVVADEKGLPIRAHRLHPEVKDSFWVNLIGRGYGAPQRAFRWCTNRLKVRPANTFIQKATSQYGESIVVLGTRKAESANRKRTMERYEQKRIREWLSPNGSLPNSWVFSPIEDWESDDVWEYLLSTQNPWGHDNRDLFNLYREGSPDRECPIVLEVTMKTPSCGQSRFGCWVCTIIKEDRSLSAMVANDPENAWMAPLVAFRDTLAASVHDRTMRDFRRQDGQIKLYNGRPNLGPYTKAARERFLRELLLMQETLRKAAPPTFRDWRLISDDEIREIRRIWVEDKHEWDDRVPLIWQEVLGIPYPYMQDIADNGFGPGEWALLSEVCGDDPLFIEMQATLLGITANRNGLFRGTNPDAVAKAIRRSFYANEEDAVAFSKQQQVFLGATSDDDTVDDEPATVEPIRPQQLQMVFDQ